jgi:heme exporter protein D
MDLGPYAAFIAAAYAAAALILGGLGLWVYADYRGLARAIDDLEARGAKRRSQR